MKSIYKANPNFKVGSNPNPKPDSFQNNAADVCVLLTLNTSKDRINDIYTQVIGTNTCMICAWSYCNTSV